MLGFYCLRKGFFDQLLQHHSFANAALPEQYKWTVHLFEMSKFTKLCETQTPCCMRCRICTVIPPRVVEVHLNKNVTFGNHVVLFSCCPNSCFIQDQAVLPRHQPAYPRPLRVYGCAALKQNRFARNVRQLNQSQYRRRSLILHW